MAYQNRERLRCKRVTLRLTDDEYKVLSDKANISEMNVNSFLRKVILYSDITIKKLPAKEIASVCDTIDKAAYEINKVGNNINQLMRVIHENNDLYSKKQIEKVVNDLENIRRHYEMLCDEIMDRLYDTGDE